MSDIIVSAPRLYQYSNTDFSMPVTLDLNTALQTPQNMATPFGMIYGIAYLFDTRNFSGNSNVPSLKSLSYSAGFFQDSSGAYPNGLLPTLYFWCPDSSDIHIIQPKQSLVGGEYTARSTGSISLITKSTQVYIAADFFNLEIGMESYPAIKIAANVNTFDQSSYIY